MKEQNSKACFILAITYFFVSAAFFVSENIYLGIIWLVCAVIELVIALVTRAKEKKKDKSI